ncbi:hypothetical protein niasHS_006895 [Heterodera schachtii]|uniref:Cytochrome c oxidase copper chaperone n=1 Tax=Heterodera schachtii TaxID=97005 RepID=A0ABD2JFV5_HETSC
MYTGDAAISGSSAQQAKTGTESSTSKPKACCVCKETKGKRDECIILNGEENCGQLIEAHKKCMREYGFEV